MSRAFVKEDDADAPVEVPERPISTNRNYVTAAGLAQIETELAHLRTRLEDAKAADDRQVTAAVTRDLRYWTARHGTAELVEGRDDDEIRFGSTVTVERDGREQTFRIVGEDEADPSAGTLSYVAPLARALAGKAEGDAFQFMGKTITILRAT